MAAVELGLTAQSTYDLPSLSSCGGSDTEELLDIRENAKDSIAAGRRVTAPVIAESRKHFECSGGRWSSVIL